MERIFTNDKSIVMQEKKIKVVWICHFSNPQIRKHLKFNGVILRNKKDFSDFAIWNTNGIKEFEKFDDIELHVISPHAYISCVQEFNINGIFYHFFGSEHNSVFEIIRKRISKKIKIGYKKNAKIICNLINKINPDIIHLIGAENPYYGEAALSISDDKPLIVSLQTLMNDMMFASNTNDSSENYKYRAKIESDIIKRSSYIGSKTEHYRRTIRENINPNAKFIDMSLAVGEDINLTDYQKKYDFVYFAVNISKAVDYAIEAYAIAKEKHPDITLHIVGGYSEEYKEKLNQKIKDLNISSGIDFTGKLATHNDVINEIRKARFALLPLKIDIVSSTIREAMANGLPVITTITPGTPTLNEKRVSVLLSEKGDFNSMANNMSLLLNNESLVKQLQENGAITITEKYGNTAFMNEWRERYYEIIKDFYNK